MLPRPKVGHLTSYQHMGAFRALATYHCRCGDARPALPALSPSGGGAAMPRQEVFQGRVVQAAGGNSSGPSVVDALLPNRYGPAVVDALLPQKGAGGGRLPRAVCGNAMRKKKQLHWRTPPLQTRVHAL